MNCEEYTYIDSISKETLYVRATKASKSYYLDSKYSVVHRVDGAAIVNSLTKTIYYMQNDKHHRLDGAAIKSRFGYQYYVDGSYICVTSVNDSTLPEEYLEAVQAYKLRAFR